MKGIYLMKVLILKDCQRKLIKSRDSQDIITTFLMTLFAHIISYQSKIILMLYLIKFANI